MNVKYLSSIAPLLAVSTAVVCLNGCTVRVAPYAPPPPPVVYQSPPGPAEIEVNAPPPPPPGPDVVIGIAPGPDFLWIPGGWFWEGRWVWHAGHYGRRPHAGARWYGPHYEFRGGRHVYVGGGWR